MMSLGQARAFTENEDMSELLNTELQDDSRYHPNLGGITQGGMANHYPMTILSMHGLGASDEQINAFKRSWPRYRASIDEDLYLVDQQEIGAHNWHEYLGQSDKLKAFRRVFMELLSEQEASQVVSDGLEKMQDGLPMGLFHPLIRLSFAVIHGDKGLLADALAYMAIRYYDLYNSGLEGFSEASIDPEQNLEQVWSIARQEFEERPLAAQLPDGFRRGSIHICELLCASEPVHQLTLGQGFNISHENLEDRMAQICGAAARIYLYEPALTTLHAVTSSQALAHLTQTYANGNDQRRLYARLWQRFSIWLTALYIEKATPSLTWQFSQKPHAEDLWSRLSETALQTNEVHTIKMVFSCKWLYENLGGGSHYIDAAELTLKP